jgi:hypothetical protein
VIECLTGMNGSIPLTAPSLITPAPLRAAIFQHRTERKTAYLGRQLRFHHLRQVKGCDTAKFIQQIFLVVAFTITSTTAF